MRQRPNELIQHHAEQIQTLCESVYNATDRNHAIVQQQLVNIFINGMHDDYTHRCLKEVKPDTLLDAIDSDMSMQEVARGSEYRMRAWKSLKSD